jgi:hypothetical protein
VARSIYPVGSSSACILNIGPGERRKRLIGGLALLCTSVLIAIAMMTSGVDRGWRVLLFFPLWAAALGVFQARDGT